MITPVTQASFFVVQTNKVQEVFHHRSPYHDGHRGIDIVRLLAKNVTSSFGVVFPESLHNLHHHNGLDLSKIGTENKYLDVSSGEGWKIGGNWWKMDSFKGIWPTDDISDWRYGHFLGDPISAQRRDRVLS